MTKKNLEKRVSELESINDQISSELTFLNSLLKKIGFSQGIETLKEAAHELLEIETQEEND